MDVYVYNCLYIPPNVFHKNVLCVGVAHLAFINAYHGRGSPVPLVQRRVEGAVVDATEAEDEAWTLGRLGGWDSGTWFNGVAFSKE